MHLFLQGCGNARYTHCSPQAVDIRIPVPHDNNLVFAENDFLQRLGFYPGLYPCILLYLLALAAVIHSIMGSLDHRLVTAPPQSQIDCIPGELIILGISKPVQAHADADSHRHLVPYIYCFYIFQQIKPVLLQRRNRFFPHNNQELVLFYLFADAIQACNILIYLSVNQCEEEGTPNLFHAFQRFFIIIQI